MSAMDLDAMRGRWKASNREVEQQLHLDVEAMRRALARRTRSAFRRHSVWLLAGIVAEALVVAALLAFMVAERNDWRYLLMSAPLAVLAGAELIVGVRQWLALSRLDFAAPLLQVRALLDVLRARRLRITRWIMLSSVLLWWPALIVLLRGLTGFDLLHVLHPSVITVTIVVGLGFIPVALAVGHLLRRRFEGTPGYQRFLQDAAGRSWSRIEDAVQASLRFEDAVEADHADRLLRQPAGAPAVVASALGALRRRVMSAILLNATLLLLTGLYNLLYAAQPLFLTAGIALYLAWIPQMVAAILHREALGRLDFSREPAQLRGDLDRPLAMRCSVARLVIVLSPLLALPMVGVVLQSSTGIDVLSADWRMVAGAAVAAAILASLAMAWIVRSKPGNSFPGAVDALLLGARQSTRELQARLG